MDLPRPNSAAKNLRGGGNEGSTVAIAMVLLARAQTLIEEIQMLHSHMCQSTSKDSGTVTSFLRLAQQEGARLQACLDQSRSLVSHSDLHPDPTSRNRISDTSGDEEKRLQYRLETANLPGMEARWGVIKRCRGLAAMTAWFPYKNTDSGVKKRQPLTNQNSVLVDAVVGHGFEWLRVCNDNQRRIEYQMAQSGWDFDDGEPGTGSGASTLYDNEGGYQAEDENEPIFVLKTTQNLVRAARLARFRYRIPRVHVVMTRIHEGQNKPVDDLLQLLRTLGGDDVEVLVDCANSVFLRRGVPLTAALGELLAEADEVDDETRTLNLDCSILLALTSDITYDRVEPQHWQSHELLSEILKENMNPGVVLRMLCHAVGSRFLVTTWDTASHFLSIVYQLGTEREKERAHILLPPWFIEEWLAAFPGLSERRPAGIATLPRPGAVLCTELQDRSLHQIEVGFWLPVSVVGRRGGWTVGIVEDHIKAGELPSVARAVGDQLKQPNMSTFMFGWARRLTTFTSNRDLRKKIERLIEENRTESREAGPTIAVSKVSRALAGTPKPTI